MPFSSCFSCVHDLVVVGGGYAAFGAALTWRKQGKSVLLLAPEGDLLWENTRAFYPEYGVGETNDWGWINELPKSTQNKQACDPSAAEIQACRQLQADGVRSLFYARPIAAEIRENQIHAIWTAGKFGFRRLVANAWIDATENGELLHLCCPDWQRSIPGANRLSLVYQATDWPDDLPDFVPLAGVQARLRPGFWSNEYRLQLELAGDNTEFWRAILPAAQALREALGSRFGGGLMSHCSILPYPVYAGTGTLPDNVPENLGIAVPAAATAPIQTPADRFALGCATTNAPLKNSKPKVDETTAIPELSCQQLNAEVAVAGAGTAGALAAIAAARNGANTICLDPLAFPGGIGAGGGIHWYYFGVTGGLQAEMDERVKQILPAFGPNDHVQGFHPEARKIVLRQLFDESGVRFFPFHTTCAAQTEAGCIQSLDAAAPGGITRIAATAFIDSTGDGDLCAFAGAPFRWGRQGDGRLHAFSQPAGRITFDDQQSPSLHMQNFDAGWVNPTDPEDLTRARIMGILRYRWEDNSETARHTAIAPALGVRQGRQLDTDYILTLADLIEFRAFPDSVGFSGCHYDNHAGDYELESDEAVFWIWCCHGWQETTACEIPYRILLPRSLKNTWIACRAAGLSADAHHSFRMQRDMLRLGEIAGIAASLSLEHQGQNRDIPLEKLQTQLIESGALARNAGQTPAHDFGPALNLDPKILRSEIEPDLDQAQLGCNAMAEGKKCRELWYLWRRGEAFRPQLLEHLASPDLEVSWAAASILAMMHDAAAQPRLLQAIQSAEDLRPQNTDGRSWLKRFSAPHALIAICLLRRCGDAACLPILAEAAQNPRLTLDARTAIAITLERLLPSLTAQREQIVKILERLVSPPIPCCIIQPHHPPRFLDDSPMDPPNAETNTVEDHTWKLYLPLARISKQLGLPLSSQIQAFSQDPRGPVRHAFQALAK